MEMWFFLDDEREPPVIEGRQWVIFRTGEAMLSIISRLGYTPDGISFDHDLGDGVMTGHDTIKEILELAMDMEICIHDKYTKMVVHSQNPVGANNIQGIIGDIEKYSQERNREAEYWDKIDNE